ncbi:MAG: hypothetical protein NW220_18810 [Leptolyngbyaceae cyanobacterium bins.349]|nr:hypothetical protein [Leptolyngbyaceae cyanobacterium bins.349]
MQRMIMIFSSIAATLFGFTTSGLAQVEPMSESPAQLLGIQERSIQKDFKTSAPVPAAAAGQPTTAGEDGGLVLYRIDRNTRVLVGPVRGNTPTADLPAQSQQGDNRLQLLHDLDQ